MAQWGKQDLANNSVKWAAESIQAGSGKANQAANNTSLFNNTTPGAFKSDDATIIGQFGVTKAAIANGGGESSKVQSIGWVLRRGGMGPVIRATGAGSGYTNGAVVLITAGSGAVNTSGVITTNGTGGIVSIGSFGNNGGKFPNVSYITVSNPNGAIAITVVTPATGYNNGDILTVSGGSVNAEFTLTTNATGNVNSAIVVSAGAGFGANNTTTKVVLAANGAATGNGVSAIAIGSAPAGGLGYNATDLVTVSNSTVNATANLAVAANGAITTLAVIKTGSGFNGPTNTVIIVLSNTGGPTGNGVSGFTINSGGTGYANGDVVTVSNGIVNATATVTTGVADSIITTLTRTANGSGFKGAGNAVVTITTSGGSAANLTPTFSKANLVPTFESATFSSAADTGTNANVVVTLGGRAGRVSYETLVATGSIASNSGSNNAQFPE